MPINITPQVSIPMSQTRDNVMASPSQSKQLLAATFCGPALAGLAEMVIFYPFEVTSRRMEAYKSPIYQRGMSYGSLLGNLRTAAFGAQYPATFTGFVANIYAGFRAAVGYRVLQRGYKYGGQPLVKELLNHLNVGSWYQGWFNERQSRIMLDGTAGMLIGALEAPLLLPVDVVKVRYQLNRQSVSGDGVFRFMMREGLGGLYRGLSCTIARNTLGAATFFGGYSAVREQMLKDESASTLTTSQKLSASFLASVASIIFSHPLDVVKTRIQSGLEGASNARQIAADIWRHEGVGGFWKGAAIKVPVTGPRVAFSFTVAQVISEAVADWLRPVVHCPNVEQKSISPRP